MCRVNNNVNNRSCSIAHIGITVKIYESRERLPGLHETPDQRLGPGANVSSARSSERTSE